STIAVPIMIGPGRVAATIGMTFFRRSLRPAQVAGSASILKATAKEAGEELRAANLARQEETALATPPGIVTGSGNRATTPPRPPKGCPGRSGCGGRASAAAPDPR